MSRSKRDQRGRRINSDLPRIGGARVIEDHIVSYGDEIGSPNGKRDAKRDVRPSRRRCSKRLVSRTLSSDREA